MVGVPIEIVSLGWVMSESMKILGAKISEKMINLKTSNKFVIPATIEIIWMLILVLGNIKLQLALVGVLIVFTPASIFVYMKLRKLEKKN